jgi:hypothetical protein
LFSFGNTTLDRRGLLNSNLQNGSNRIKKILGRTNAAVQQTETANKKTKTENKKQKYKEQETGTVGWQSASGGA